MTSVGSPPRLAAVSRQDHLAGVPEEVIRVLSVLPSASLVVDSSGTVLRASARSMALGLVNRNLVTIPDISHLIERVAEDGTAREQEMRVRRPPLGRELLELRVRVAALGTGAMLVLIDDLADLRDRLDGPLGIPLDGFDFVTDVFSRLGCLLSQFLDLVGDDGEALPRLTRASRLDRRVQRQQVGLLSD